MKTASAEVENTVGHITEVLEEMLGQPIRSLAVIGVATEDDKLTSIIAPSFYGNEELSRSLRYDLEVCNDVGYWPSSWKSRNQNIDLRRVAKIMGVHEVLSVYAETDDREIKAIHCQEIDKFPYPTSIQYQLEMFLDVLGSIPDRSCTVLH